MTRRIDVLDQSEAWTTLEDMTDEDFLLALPDGQPCGGADWYQDSPLYTLPKECTPHWRTVH